jgi:hypothetical protein
VAIVLRWSLMEGIAGIRNLHEAIIDFLGKHRIPFEYISLPRLREYIKQFISVSCKESALSRGADDRKTLVNDASR